MGGEQCLRFFCILIFPIALSAKIEAKEEIARAAIG